MQDRTVRYLNMGRRVNDFTDAQTPPFPANSRAAVLTGIIKAAVTTLETEGAKQEAAHRAGMEATARKKAAFAALLLLMSAINRIARGMNKLHPGIAALFRMPRGRADQTVLNTAYAYITEATPIIAEFTGRGLSTDFLNTFEVAINECLSTIAAQDAARNAYAKSTAAVKAAERQLIDAVGELSPIIYNTLRDDPAALATWRSASHVERAPKRAKQPTPPTTTPTSQADEGDA